MQTCIQPYAPNSAMAIVVMFTWLGAICMSAYYLMAEDEDPQENEAGISGTALVGINQQLHEPRKRIVRFRFGLYRAAAAARNGDACTNTHGFPRRSNRPGGSGPGQQQLPKGKGGDYS